MTMLLNYARLSCLTVAVKTKQRPLILLKYLQRKGNHIRNILMVFLNSGVGRRDVENGKIIKPLNTRQILLSVQLLTLPALQLIRTIKLITSLLLRKRLRKTDCQRQWFRQAMTVFLPIHLACSILPRLSGCTQSRFSLYIYTSVLAPPVWTRT